MNAVSDATSFGMGAPSRGHVGNQHFDAYRKATGRGGDFVIYSDVYWESINLQFELG